MTQKRLFGISGAIATAALIGGLLAGCMEKDLYDPNYGKEPLPDPSEYFGFETRGDVKLSVNYDVPGLVALLEVYDEDPMEVVDNVPVKKEGVEALFKIFTDGNGKYEGKMNIPTSVETVYLYTSSWGVPRCVKLDIKDGMASFDMSKKDSSTAKTKAVTRSYNFNGNAPYLINSTLNLYSLCAWDENGLPRSPYITNVGKVGDENIGDLVSRMKQFFSKNNYDNSYLFISPDVANIAVTQEGTSLDVVFVNKDATYHNTFGYYFYRTDDMGNANVHSGVKKYIIFPNVALTTGDGWGAPVLRCGDKVHLLYFDDKGNSSTTFPAGYTVGFFILPNAYDFSNNEIKLVNYNSNFVTVKDEKSGKTIIGVEDGANDSYCDLLFYVDTSPESSIDNPNRPSIPDDNKPIEVPDADEGVKGTLAFEDIWPNGGDYDMNDVIVEYKRTVYFNADNMINKIVDTSTPTHDGAMYDNAFAYQIDGGQFGKVTSDKDIKVESETSSIIVFPSVKQAVKGKVGTCTITRTFEKATFNKENLKIYNPYIIVKYAAGQQNRTEVHLPKYSPTSYADKSLIGSSKDVYYIDRDGAYPFAIDIPMLNFIPVTETHNIDTEYPYFKNWADSWGSKSTDWYKRYQSPKN